MTDPENKDASEEDVFDEKSTSTEEDLHEESDETTAPDPSEKPETSDLPEDSQADTSEDTDENSSKDTDQDSEEASTELAEEEADEDSEETSDAESVDDESTEADEDMVSDEDESAEADEEATSDEDESPEDSVLPLVNVVEAIIFAARNPLKLKQIAKCAGKRIRPEAVQEAIDTLNQHYTETSRAFEIVEVAERFQLMSRPEYATHIQALLGKALTTAEKEKKLTPTALDTLSIIAYKQPITRQEVEAIRGVGCGNVLRGLIERGSIKVIGRKTDVIGYPPLYGTTPDFLEEFGLGTLENLPMVNELRRMTGTEAPLPDGTEEDPGVEALSPQLTLLPKEDPEETELLEDLSEEDLAAHEAAKAAESEKLPSETDEDLDDEDLDDEDLDDEDLDDEDLEDEDLEDEDLEDEDLEDEDLEDEDLDDEDLDDEDDK